MNTKPQIEFRLIGRNESSVDGRSNTVYLKIDHWNDYSFVTMFEVFAYDEKADLHKLPNIKIGFVGQTVETSTHETLEKSFFELPTNYFAVATDIDFYRSLARDFSEAWRSAFLSSLRDVVYDPTILEIAKPETVFKTSHLRSVSINSIATQFPRVLAGDAPPTDFLFHFTLPSSEKFAEFDLEFRVEAGSLPSSNIHAIIGRNGVGKTTLLKHMVKAVAGRSELQAQFYEPGIFGAGRKALGKSFFANL